LTYHSQSIWIISYKYVYCYKKVAIASPVRIEIPYVDGRKYSVPLFSDFIDVDILDMIDATSSGSSRDIPGLSDYLRWKKAKDEALDKGSLLDAKRYRE